MDSLAGYVATLGVGIVGTYLSQFLLPKVKIRYWLPHNFMYRIPNAQLAPALPPMNRQAAPPGPQQPPHFFLLSQSILIQNFGRKSAEWVEIAHKKKPDFFHLEPA